MDARLRPADDRQKHRRSQTDQTALDRNIDAQSLTEAVDFENHNQSLPKHPARGSALQRGGFPDPLLRPFTPPDSLPEGKRVCDEGAGPAGAAGDPAANRTIYLHRRRGHRRGMRPVRRRGRHLRTASAIWSATMEIIAVDYESLVHALAVYVRCFTLKECGLSPDDSLRAIFLIVRSSVSFPKYSTPQCDRDLLIGLCL